MTTVLIQVLFWITVFAVFWTYAGYHIFLWVYSRIVKKEVMRQSIVPGVTIIVTACNERARIEEKISNCLSLDYPADKLEIIVASDGSTDGTDDLVRTFASKGVILVSSSKRRGKHYAQALGVQEAKNDILVFTDATTSLKRDAVRIIVRNFSDPKVGCVSGIDKTKKSDNTSQGEGLYVEYEMKLRKLESSTFSLVGVSGSFFAVRKHLCDDWHNDLSSDFFLPIIAYQRGFRSVLDDDAVGVYGLTKDPAREFGRKVRTVVHGLDVVYHFAEILNPLKYGFFSLQMISHKLMRWSVPYLLIICLILNIMLTGEFLIYDILLALQAIFYLTALAAYLIKGLQKQVFFKIPFFFTMVNASVFVAWMKFLRGERFVTWERTTR